MTGHAADEIPDRAGGDDALSPRSSDFTAAWSEIRRLGLESHVAELEAVGYTVVPPEKVATAEFMGRMLDAFRRTLKKRTGLDLDRDPDQAPAWLEDVVWQPMTFMCFEDPVFQDAVVNPTSLAFADLMVGRSCMLSTCIGLVKGQGGEELDLHSDHAALGIPSPFPPYTLFLNCTWVLTDYTEEGGALCLVPGSHRYATSPREGEALDERVAIVAPAGSLVVWGGSAWHGSFTRTSPGVRLTLVTGYTRSFVVPQERYREEVTPQILERNGPRFHELMGKNIYQYSFKEEGYDPDKVALTPGKSWWD